MSARKNLEQRAQEAILKSIVENFKKERSDWRNEPAIRKALLANSFFGTQNALLIAFLIVLAGVLGVGLSLFTGPLTGLLVGGGVGLLALLLIEALFLYRSVTNGDLHAEAVAELFKERVNFEPTTIQDKELREKVDKALEYWKLIDDEIDKVPKGILRDGSPHAVTRQEATNWLQAVYTLAGHVDKLKLNQVILKDLDRLPKLIKKNKNELSLATSPEVRRQLEQTIADQERQLKSLENLKANMDKASYQLDSTISSLGTIYSQLLLVGSKDESGSRIRRLQEDISEQVHQLEDITDAMDDVLYSRSY